MHSDLLNTTNLERVLGQRPFRFFNRISSTNDVARHWALEDPTLPTGALVIANEQIAGRGRLGREWHTPPDQALAISIIIRPQISPEQLHQVTMLGGGIVVETLKAYCDDEISIKWPNDVQINRRKVSGILSEAVWAGQEAQAVIIGIGINIRVNFSGTPLEVYATSLEDHSPAPVQRIDIINRLIELFDRWYSLLGTDQLVKHWRNHLNTLGQPVSIHTHQGIIAGIAKDVDSSGALLVIDNTGHTHHILVGDVKPRPDRT